MPIMRNHHLFLSHLCGGEVNKKQLTGEKEFLSHLCGGEGASIVSVGIGSFLSHLCGGEARCF